MAGAGRAAPPGRRVVRPSRTMHSNSHPTRQPNPAASARSTIRCSWCRGESSHSGGVEVGQEERRVALRTGYGRPVPGVDRGRLAAPAPPLAPDGVVRTPPLDGVDEAPALLERAPWRPGVTSRFSRRMPEASKSPRCTACEPGLAGSHSVRSPSRALPLARRLVPAAPSDSWRRSSLARTADIERASPRSRNSRSAAVAMVSRWVVDRLLQRGGTGRPCAPALPRTRALGAHFGTVAASTSTWNCTPHAHAPDAKGLHRTVIVPGQDRRRHRAAGAPRPHATASRERASGRSAEDRVVETGRGQRELHDADLRLPPSARPCRPRASASNWCPRQTPRKGRSRSTTQRRMAAFSVTSQGCSASSHTSIGPPMHHEHVELVQASGIALAFVELDRW